MFRPAPSALLMTGGRDRLVEPGNSTRLAARLVAAGNAATVLTYRRVGHFIIMAAVAPFLRFLVPVLRDVDAFIAETLRKPRETIPACCARNGRRLRDRRPLVRWI